LRIIGQTIADQGIHGRTVSHIRFDKERNKREGHKRKTKREERDKEKDKERDKERNNIPAGELLDKQSQTKVFMAEERSSVSHITSDLTKRETKERDKREKQRGDKERDKRERQRKKKQTGLRIIGQTIADQGIHGRRNRETKRETKRGTK